MTIDTYYCQLKVDQNALLHATAPEPIKPKVALPPYVAISDRYTVKKASRYYRSQPGCHLPNSPWPGIIYPIPVPERFGQNKSRNLVEKFTVYGHLETKEFLLIIAICWLVNCNALKPWNWSAEQ